MANRNIFRNYDNDPNETWYRKAGRAIGVAGRAVGRAGKATGEFVYDNFEMLATLSIPVGMLTCVVGGIIYTSSDYSTNKEYHYFGKIGSDTVEFKESHNGRTNYLGITREDGTFVLFTDNKKDDLQIDEFSVRTCIVTKPATASTFEQKSCNEAVYSMESNDTKTQQIVKDNQAVFDSYLEKILDQYLEPAGLNK